MNDEPVPEWVNRGAPMVVPWRDYVDGKVAALAQQVDRAETDLRALADRTRSFIDRSEWDSKHTALADAAQAAMTSHVAASDVRFAAIEREAATMREQISKAATTGRVVLIMLGLLVSVVIATFVAILTHIAPGG